jgi:hypothetical protein
MPLLSRALTSDEILQLEQDPEEGKTDDHVSHQAKGAEYHCVASRRDRSWSEEPVGKPVAEPDPVDDHEDAKAFEGYPDCGDTEKCESCAPPLGHSSIVARRKVRLAVSLVTLSASLLVSSCASIRGKDRVLVAVAAGSVAGAGGGASLSPNDESRGLNAIVFGLSGALVGGAVALLTDPEPNPEPGPSSLKDREIGLGGKSRDYLVVPHQELPEFLKRRVQPVVIEEYVESDRVTEEGTLHEPHRAYRIKQPAELFAKPVPGRDERPNAKSEGAKP